MEFEKGDEVRLITDPGRQGVVLNDRERGGKTKYRVKFSDGSSWHIEDELEMLEDTNSNLFDLIEFGRYGRASDLRRNLTHIQLSGKLANLVYSMDATNTEFHAYQYKPLISFMDSPAKGMLIADEVGLGKTIEAGLIWTELRARYDARRLLVVCPAMLRDKWKAELHNRFGIEADIMGASELGKEIKRSRYDVPDGRGFICSLDGIKPPRGWNENGAERTSRNLLAAALDAAENELPLFDLVIFDEAHYMRNPDSQNSKLGRMLREVSENVLLLSATPVNLKSEDLFHLLNLVDPDTFSRPEIFPEVLRANAPLINARTAALDLEVDLAEVCQLLRQAQQHHRLTENRQLATLVAELEEGQHSGEEKDRVEIANRIERINLLRHVVSRTRKVEVQELRVIREPTTHYVEPSPNEEAFYQAVTQAVRRFAVSRDISEGFLLAMPQRQVSSCMYAAAHSWATHQWIDTEQTYEDLGVDSIAGRAETPLRDTMARDVLPDVDVAELRRVDSKYNALISLLKEFFADNPEEKLILFAYYKPTLRYLHERLAEDGITSKLLMGGITQPKQQVIDEFKASEETKVLLCSEVASEGVDLQFCRLLVNYDLPWNPMKVEQRIGRIDRIGQQADKIQIINLCYANTIDERIVRRLFERLKIFEAALGDLESILGDEINMLTRDLLSQELTPQQEEARVKKAAIAIENLRNTEAQLEADASSLIAHGGFILDKVKAAHDMKQRISAFDLVLYVRDYLDRFCPGHLFYRHENSDYTFDIQLPGSTTAPMDEFVRQQKLVGKSRLSTGNKIVCTFSNKVYGSGEKGEVVSQFHPLVRFISAQLNPANEGYYPLVAVETTTDDASIIAPGDYVFFLKRWSFEGLRVEEELSASAIDIARKQAIDHETALQLVNRARLHGRDWLACGNQVDAQFVVDLVDICMETIDARYQDVVKRRIEENEDRIDFQVSNAQRHRDRLLKTQQGILQRHKELGRLKLIPMVEGKMAKIEQRFDLALAGLKRQTSLTYSSSDVCTGVIRVY